MKLLREKLYIEKITDEIFVQMKRKASEMSDTLERDVVIDNETPFCLVSEENIHRYQEQVCTQT